MKTNIQKIGNNAGLILPSEFLKKLDLSEGDVVDVYEIDTHIVITPQKNKPEYKLQELLSQSDLAAPMPEVVTEWDNIQPVGRELLWDSWFEDNDVTDDFMNEREQTLDQEMEKF